MAQIIVIDLGSQLSHLIARRVREMNVYSDVYPNNISADEIKKFKGLKGIIFSGGPSSIYDKDVPDIDKNILDIGIPILGICYGHQLLAHHINGDVKRGSKREYGITDLDIIDPQSKLFSNIKPEQKVWMNHGDVVMSVPNDFTVTAKTANSPVAAFEKNNLYGIQFHPEVTHTRQGKEIIFNFVFEICKSEKDWDMKDFIEKKVGEIKDQIKDRKAIIGLSGGIDSSTTAALVSKAIGKNLTAIFIDTGFMRMDEAEEIKDFFKEWDINLKIVDSSELFINNLEDVEDPENKRKIIGRLFIEEFEREAKKIDAEYLVQGTIYPDIIESGSTANSSTIKSHHNVGGLPEKMNLKLCEPVRDLYKDEVRAVASKLGLDKKLINRHPFPGPGLAIRIIGKCTRENILVVKKANKILMEELENNDYYDSTWQAFAVLLPIKSVGVQGDARAYKKVIAIRMIDSVDAMTANFTRAPHELLEKISTRITNEIEEIGRVVYDITNKPPSTIEWE